MLLFIANIINIGANLGAIGGQTAFYATITLATVVGTAVEFSPVDPIKAPYWSAVINGVVSCPVMVTIMLMTRRPDIMG